MKAENSNNLFLSIDAGSTTIKIILAEFYEPDKISLPKAHNNCKEVQVLYRDYQRHSSRPLQKLYQMLQEPEEKFLLKEKNIPLFVTGSAGTTIAKILQARFVQEVTAVTGAVENMYPHVNSVIELGGQDAKMIFFKEADANGNRRKIATMNDKCAGGTGAVIDKIASKLNLCASDMATLAYDNTPLHFVAGKCGVFAETDINGLQKQGVPANELMASLYQAIVLQNLSVLTRGNVIVPSVMLLGGPNSFLPGMQQAWRYNLSRYWQERNLAYDDNSVLLPHDSLYFAALGAILYGKELENNSQDFLPYQGREAIEKFLNAKTIRENSSGRPLLWQKSEIAELQQKQNDEIFSKLALRRGQNVNVFAGIDGGSTSCKGVFLNEKGELLARSYRLSQGNPLQDAIFILKDLYKQLDTQGVNIRLVGMGVTGYSKDILQKTFAADVSLVETVAHMRAAKHFYPEVDVIVDVGGQDIKIIYMKNGQVRDFRLNTQCSAGNGYFLQSAAKNFGYEVEDYAEAAFSAQEFPVFSCGCAVFLQSDIVDFQRQGWKPEEIMAGLADVLPRNIWQYVAEENNLQKLGSTFVLQGGTQKNLSAVKAQMDYIRKKFSRSDIEPNIFVHRFSAEAGAAGAAIESIDLMKERQKENPYVLSTFIGFEQLDAIGFGSRRDEKTRCHFCRNHCLRTFIDIHSGGEIRRVIVAPCEKGENEKKEDMQKTNFFLKETRQKNPDLSQYAARLVWAQQTAVSQYYRKKYKIGNYFENMRIGVPRVLNLYNLMPFFSAFFETLGLKTDNLIYSSYTNAELYRQAASRGSVDPCFPSKVTLAHVHELLFHKENLDAIFFPHIDSFSSPLCQQVDERACPTAAGSAAMVYASFTREEDIFKNKGIDFYAPYLNLIDREVVARQLYNYFKAFFPKLKKYDVRLAASAGMAALRRYDIHMQAKGRKILQQVEKEGRMAIVLLSRPYHNDPGIQHEISNGIQKNGFPILPISALPRDSATLKRVFPNSSYKEAMSIRSVWKNAFSVNSSLKIWAARYVAHHPHLAAVELSNFKCGHDAPIYSTIEKILESSKSPHFVFGDIDENNPSGSIAIRLETMAYFLHQKTENLRWQKLQEKQEESLCATPAFSLSALVK